MAAFTDREGEKSLHDQYGLDGQRIRQGSPVHVTSDDGVRPLDLSKDERVDAIVLRKEKQPTKRGSLEDVVVRKENDSHRIVEYENGGGASRTEVQKAYDEELPVPIKRVVVGDMITLHSISTADCDAYMDDEAPTFEEGDPVSLVEDSNVVDGVGIAPREDIDGRTNEIDLGTVGYGARLMGRKTSFAGFNELIPVVVEV